MLTLNPLQKLSTYGQPQVDRFNQSLTDTMIFIIRLLKAPNCWETNTSTGRHQTSTITITSGGPHRPELWRCLQTNHTNLQARQKTGWEELENSPFWGVIVKSFKNKLDVFVGFLKKVKTSRKSVLGSKLNELTKLGSLSKMLNT